MKLDYLGTSRTVFLIDHHYGTNRCASRMSNAIVRELLAHGRKGLVFMFERPSAHFRRFLQRVALHVAAIALALIALPTAVEAAEIRSFENDSQTGTSQAVRVGGLPLIQTTQFLPLDLQQAVVGADNVSEQTRHVLKLANEALEAKGSSLARAVKLNVYLARSSDRAAVEAVFAKQFAGDVRPAACYVTTSLPNAGCLVGLDVIAAGAVSNDGPPSVQRLARYPSPERHVSVLPMGARVYVSGQAEKGADLAAATRATLGSLRKTLEFLGLKDRDIVQVKSFVNPKAELVPGAKASLRPDIDVVRDEISKFYGPDVPPLAFVDWSLPLIEIEVVVAAGPERDGAAIEYLTPPGMTASPIFARVTRINHGPTIFLSGQYGSDRSNATREVESLFQGLEQLLKMTGSDLRHMAKATYYVASDDTSKKLNEVRPKIYDPQRPPAASKAVVLGAGRVDRDIVIDMIAVPTDDAR